MFKAIFKLNINQFKLIIFHSISIYASLSFFIIMLYPSKSLSLFDKQLTLINESPLAEVAPCYLLDYYRLEPVWMLWVLDPIANCCSNSDKAYSWAQTAKADTLVAIYR